METVAGEWIMKGCRRSDPECLHSPEDLLILVRKVGFLPLFSNGIPGFSVEEHTPPADWWTGSSLDPWDWRQLLAPHPDIAYGKFFDRKAGFVSREWFPRFANYRRDGYDWEGMYEDGRMTGRCRRILDVLALDENAAGRTMLTGDLRKQAALEKGFEGALTDLQMKTFLIMGSFRRRRNRQGEEYGWHVAEMMTPETKWNCDEVNACNEKPAESWGRITEHVRKHFPGASGPEIQKVLGIRY